MRTLLTALLLTGAALAAPLTITPPTQEVQPGALVILTASELSNWATSAGTLGSAQGTRIVLEAPKTPGPVTVTVTDPKDASRRAFAVVTVKAPVASSAIWKPSTIAAGFQFSAAVGTDGKLWVWGNNEQKVLPGLSAKVIPTPTQVDSITQVQSVAASPRTRGEGSMVAVIAADDTAWFWGGGTPNPVARSSQAEAAQLRGCTSIMQKDGSVMGAYDKLKVNNIAYLNGSWDSSNPVNAVIDQNGNLFVSKGYCSPDFKQVANLKNVVAAEGMDSGIFVAATVDGRGFIAKNWQFNPLAGFTDIYRMTTAGKFGFIVKKDGSLHQFSLDKNENPSIPAQVKGMSDIVDVSISGGHVLALRRDGTLFAMGNNQYGQLGNGATQNSNSFVPVVGLKVKVP